MVGPEDSSNPGFFAGGGFGAFNYPGPETTLTFENGTTFTYPNCAEVKASLTNVTSGEAFYQKFCNDSSSFEGIPSTRSSRIGPSSNTTTSVPRYPAPIVSHAEKFISGYYLPNSDVAVLSIPTFISKGGNPSLGQCNDFRRSLSNFWLRAKQQERRSS